MPRIDTSEIYEKLNTLKFYWNEIETNFVERVFLLVIQRQIVQNTDSCFRRNDKKSIKKGDCFQSPFKKRCIWKIIAALNHLIFCSCLGNLRSHLCYHRNFCRLYHSLICLSNPYSFLLMKQRYSLRWFHLLHTLL